MKSYVAKPGEVEAKWHLIDADGVVLGRLSGIVAKILRGKHRPQFTPNIDKGDHVIIINAEKVKITGDKKNQSVFYWHTGHTGGIKGRTQGQILDGKHPERVLQKAIERMMPKDSALADKQMGKLHVYAGGEHPHTAQQPQTLDVAGMNPKNKRDQLET